MKRRDNSSLQPVAPSKKSSAGDDIFSSSIPTPTLLTPGTVNFMPGTVNVMLGAANFMSGTVAVRVANFYVDVSF
jgi:hypothetical protein